MKYLRIALFAVLAGCSSSVVWAQYGLYGSPEAIRVPQPNADLGYSPLPTYYPATAAPVLQPASTAAFQPALTPAAQPASAPVPVPVPVPAYYPPQTQYRPMFQPQYGYPPQSQATAMYQPYQPGGAISLSGPERAARHADRGR